MGIRKIVLFLTSVFLAGLLHGCGSVEIGNIESDALGVSKDFVVYLPDGYSESEKHYPVIYVLHGWGVTERMWTSPALDIQGIADDLKLQAIIVMPDGDRNVYVNALTWIDYEECLNTELPNFNLINNETHEGLCVRTANYEDYFLGEIIPHIDNTYRTIPKREARALSGESAGGLASMHLALRHQEQFSSVASHSGVLALLYNSQEQRRKTSVESDPGMEGFGPMFGPDIARWREYEPWSLLDSLENGVLSIYLDCGTGDEFGFFPMSQQFQLKLVEKELAHTYQWMEGGLHDDLQFKKGMQEGLKFHAEHFRREGVYP
jgi:S-formylglutathione hydrolase FrmB